MFVKRRTVSSINELSVEQHSDGHPKLSKHLPLESTNSQALYVNMKEHTSRYHNASGGPGIGSDSL